VSDNSAGGAVRDLRTLFEAGAVGGLADGPLLARFVARGEEAVFEAIVRRHGPMVWGVCRRILQDHHDAEDASQATFLVLARRAASVRPREKLGHWLYGVACRTARKARAARAKRRARETPMPVTPEAGTPTVDRPDDLLLRLDRELSRLPEKYRAPVVLCELEGLTHGEAAGRLGWPVGTLSGRLSRGRALLAGRLSRPGQRLSGGSLAVRLAEDAALVAVPRSWFAATARAACRSGKGAAAAGSVPAGVIDLTREVCRAMWISKLKLVAAVSAVTFTLAAGGAGVVFRTRADDRPDAKRSTPGEVPPAPLALAQAPEPAPEPPASYPFKLDPTDVYEFPDLAVDFRDFHYKAGPVSVAPITTERGITGAMILGDGTFRYTPEKDKAIEGRCRAVMLRFSPEERATILPLGRGNKVSDRGSSELSRHLLQVVIRHCWQSSKDGGRRQEVLIPPKGAFAAVLYSREHGDLLISGDGRAATAYSFTDRKILYEKK